MRVICDEVVRYQQEQGEVGIAHEADNDLCRDEGALA
jgi:hypothetical protein